jgi:UDP-glucose-4-epimerase GalE
VRVLATGGAGYVGSHAVRALRRAGHEVTVLDDLSRGHRSFVETLGVPLIECDLRDAPAVERALARGWDAVLHFAALALVGESCAHPALYWDVNVRGGLVLLEAMRKAGVQRLVVSSTAAVYGEPGVPLIAEGQPREPLNPYGQTKLAFELLLEREARAFGLRSLALRYFNVAGASEEGDLGERHDPETHLLPNLIRAIRTGESFRVLGRDHATRDGTCLRDFVHVEDLARAHVLGLERLGSLEAPVTALNIGTGRGATVLEVVAAAEQVLGRKARLEDAPRRPGDPSSLVADPSLAAKVLGFRATRTLEDAIRSADRFLARG